LTACTVLQFLTDGILKSFGLFYVAILEEFKETVTFTTMITGIMNGVYCLTCKFFKYPGNFKAYSEIVKCITKDRSLMSKSCNGW
jgi:hypothetical protein